MTETPVLATSSVSAVELVRRHAQPGRSLLAVLHAIQDETGYVPPSAVAPLAQALNLSRAEVHGVLTYYHHFRTQPPPALTIQLCRAEACRSMGVEALSAHIEACTGQRFDTSGNPALGLESVYCLGQCALAPAMTLNGTLHAKVTAQKFTALLAAERDSAPHTGEGA
ncbi:NAD(P)H-dependent oxidoreductase subunit E [Paraburkholderia hayleyella]|uniref:NAD(P)H-dependent oxidoreductase subunit E n=1 Tax=Paraburkholderia hayleyella TaxID=2152889 RepID=UPI0012914439|nr:NAD(P)H-dependent oxidoreductase subunit E [Paraburkholderia hayleyella]